MSIKAVSELESVIIKLQARSNAKTSELVDILCEAFTAENLPPVENLTKALNLRIELQELDRLITEFQDSGKEVPAASHIINEAGDCSCGQDGVTCQKCASRICGNSATWITGVGNFCPECLHRERVLGPQAIVIARAAGHGIVLTKTNGCNAASSDFKTIKDVLAFTNGNRLKIRNLRDFVVPAGQNALYA